MPGCRGMHFKLGAGGSGAVIRAATVRERFGGRLLTRGSD